MRSNTEDSLEKDLQLGSKNKEKTGLSPQKVEVMWGKFVKMKKQNFLQDYKIVNEIGRGAFGCVYKVSPRNGCGMLKAAKRINKNKLKSKDHQSLLG